MTLDDLKKMFVTGYVFHKETGLPSSSWHNWLKQGHIPILSQIKIEAQTGGKLKANLDHVPKPKRRNKNGSDGGVDV
jgi:hypothetical protein